MSNSKLIELQNRIKELEEILKCRRCGILMNAVFETPLPEQLPICCKCAKKKEHQRDKSWDNVILGLNLLRFDLEEMLESIACELSDDSKNSMTTEDDKAVDFGNVVQSNTPVNIEPVEKERPKRKAKRKIRKKKSATIARCQIETDPNDKDTSPSDLFQNELHTSPVMEHQVNDTFEKPECKMTDKLNEETENTVVAESNDETEETDEALEVGQMVTLGSDKCSIVSSDHTLIKKRDQFQTEDLEISLKSPSPSEMELTSSNEQRKSIQENDQDMSGCASVLETQLVNKSAAEEICLKENYSFKTPKRLVIDENNVDQPFSTESDSNESLVLLSVKELNVLLETAKKKAREEVLSLMSTKKVLDQSLSEIEGILPLDKLGDPVQTQENQIVDLATGSDDSDDVFILPTPRDQKKKGCLIATKISEKDKKVLASYIEKFGVQFSIHLDPTADILVTGDETAITLKRLFAKVIKVPTVHISWIHECMKQMSELPLEPYCVEVPSGDWKLPKVFLKMDIVLQEPFLKFAQSELEALLNAAGAKISRIGQWKADHRMTSKLRLIAVEDNTIILDSESKLKELSSKFRAPIVDIDYFITVFSTGNLQNIQDFLMIPISEKQLSSWGFPGDMLADGLNC